MNKQNLKDLLIGSSPDGEGTLDTETGVQEITKLCGFSDIGHLIEFIQKFDRDIEAETNEHRKALLLELFYRGYIDNPPNS